MSRQTDDLIDRIEGTTYALRGTRVTLSPGGAAGPPSDVPPPPAPQVHAEDYAYAKQLAQTLKALAGDLEAQISRESHVPEPAAPAGAAETKSETSSHKGKGKDI